MFRAVPLVFVLAASTAFAGSVGTYSGCKSLKGERGACEACVGGGNFYQPGQGCGMAAGMHKSKSAAREKLPPKPTSMPKWQKSYVTIKPGTFAIGARVTDPDKDDSKEVFNVNVTLTHAFQMKTTEVTQGEWYFLMGSLTPSYEKSCGLDCPAGSVSWSQAVLYLNALSKKEGLEPCYVIKGGLATWPRGYDCTGYRLPTDAEWEYAARAGSEDPRTGEVDDIAWHYDNSEGAARPVGKKQPSAWGLYDMLGSTWEWVWDAEEYKPYTEDVTDPIIGGQALESESNDRVMRGASFRDATRDMRATIRFQYLANSGSNNHGFRPVRTVAAAK